MRPELPAHPRSMRDPLVRRRRREMLNLPHVAPLTAFVGQLRERGDAEYPYFDPLDGGVSASLLFLFEKPGPMTASKHNHRGSGFISRDNDDPTAEATFYFMQAAGISRRETVIWNIVPGWNGTRNITSHELVAGVCDFESLLSLLPKIRATVLVGRKAARAKNLITSVPVFTSDHPSPLVRARYPERWGSIPEVWAEAALTANG